jgi:conjugal transfer ATP-binding protein TraC
MLLEKIKRITAMFGITDPDPDDVATPSDEPAHHDDKDQGRPHKEGLKEILRARAKLATAGKHESRDESGRELPSKVTGFKEWLAGVAASVRGHPDNVSFSQEDVFLPRSGKPELYDRFSDYLPWTVFDGDRDLFWIEGTKSGESEGLGFMLELNPQTGSNEAMANYLAGMTRLPAPNGASIQVSLFASPQIEHVMDYVRSSTVTPTQADEMQAEGRAGAPTAEQAKAMQSMAEKMEEYFIKGTIDPLFSNFNYRFKDYRVVLSGFWPTKDPENVTTLEKVVAFREQVISTLNQYYLYSHTLKAEDLLHLTSLLLNPHRMYQRDWPTRHYDSNKELRYQVIDRDTAINIDESSITFSGEADKSDAVTVRMMSATTYPPSITLNKMKELLGSNGNDRTQYTGPVLITAGFSFLDYEASKQNVQLRAARAQQNAESPLARYLPSLVDTASDWKLLQDAYDTGLGSVKMYHQVMIFGSPETIDDAEQAAKSIWREAGFELQRDRYIQVQGMLASMPMCFGPLLQRDMKLAQKLSTMTSYNAANLLPLIAEWKGTGPRSGENKPTPQIVVGGRHGQVMPVDIFANPGGNFNACVIGKSGSGKSFTLNMMVTRTLACAGRAWIFDIGGSYKKLCDRFGGQYLEFSPESEISLNPFSIVTDLDEDISMLKGVLARMIKPTEQMTDYEMAQLEQHVRSVFVDAALAHQSGQQELPYPSIEDLAMSLINNCSSGGPNPLGADPEWQTTIANKTYEERRALCDPRVSDMGRCLIPYTSDGTYGKWFTGTANINFSSNLVVLEMEHLAAKPELRAVVLMLLMYLISQEMYLGRRDLPKVMLVDEAWDLLRSGATATFIEGLFRKARKYGAAIITATQSVNDYEASPASRAALENADWMFLLAQKPESIEALARTGKLLLDDGMKRDLKSVRRDGQRYSEIFIKCSDVPPTVGRLFADPYSALMGTTTAHEVQMIEDLQAQGFSLDQSINAILASRGKLRAGGARAQLADVIEVDEVAGIPER